MSATPTDTRVPRGTSDPTPRPKGWIDPRIRARRVAVIRRRGRRRLGALVAIVALFATAGTAWLALESPVLDVDRITVTGAGDVPVETVVGATGVELGDALAFVDTAAVAASVETLGEVAAASVERSFPGTLVIAITEADPVAWAVRPTSGDPAADPDGTSASVLIDAAGHVTEEVAEPPAGLVQIQGLATIPPVGEAVRPQRSVTLLGQLPDGLRRQVTLVIVDVGQVTLVLAPNADGVPSAQEIRLGAPREIVAKGAAAAAVLGALEADVGYLDVRVPTAPATGG